MQDKIVKTPSIPLQKHPSQPEKPWPSNESTLLEVPLLG